MGKVKVFRTVPEGSMLARDFGPVDYVDSYRIDGLGTADLDRAAVALFRSPRWVNGLMWLRNTLMRPFGLKTGPGAGPVPLPDETFHPVGGRLALFEVLARGEREIVLGMDDKHLDFRVSLLGGGDDLWLTTVVRFNNRGGRLYFKVIRPFHALIVGSLARRTARRGI
ncbi:MAG: DUF2867 domain-containing protein [Rikenellaceae bacterium]|nr:DUF2867 domain-containing protein [Rikenellaceae bacterium]